MRHTLEAIFFVVWAAKKVFTKYNRTFFCRNLGEKVNENALHKERNEETSAVVEGRGGGGRPEHILPDRQACLVRATVTTIHENLTADAIVAHNLPMDECVSCRGSRM
jgi:hypothetical protein